MFLHNSSPNLFYFSGTPVCGRIESEKHYHLGMRALKGCYFWCLGSFSHRTSMNSAEWIPAFHLFFIVGIHLWAITWVPASGVLGGFLWHPTADADCAVGWLISAKKYLGPEKLRISFFPFGYKIALFPGRQTYSAWWTSGWGRSRWTSSGRRETWRRSRARDLVVFFSARREQVEGGKKDSLILV